MDEETYAIIDDAGIIVEGPETFVSENWNSEGFWNGLETDTKHKGDCKLVKILEVRH